MAERFPEKNVEMQRLTQHYVTELTNIWVQLFEPSLCEDNLNKLLSHAKSFYEDLVTESLQKKSSIEKELADLQEEAETLCRLLKTDITLPSVNDGTPLLQVQSEMDRSLADLRELLRQRQEEICELLLEQESLCDELGESPRPLVADPLPTANELEVFRTHLEQLKVHRVEKMGELSALRREIKGYLQTLELNVGTENEEKLLNERAIKLDKETFSGLKRMRDLYGGQVEQMRSEIDGMRKKLETLWDRLNTSPSTRNKFKRRNDITQHTYDIYYGELQRCEMLKSQNIKQYVQQVREEIAEYWDKTLKSEKQRNRFTYFTSNCYTDDLLSLHELELEDLKSFYNNNKQIFQLFSDRKILWDRMVALETKATDPARYNNRGGQLLREEKERKTIATKLPKIELQIKELVQTYEEREHEPFLVYGENIVDVMDGEWAKKRQEKEKMSSARKNGQTPLSKSQLLAGRTPLSMKNVSSISMRKTPSTASLASIKSNAMTTGQKRKLNPTEKHTPSAKRSLMHALNSPSIFLRPTATLTGSTQKNRVKSPSKKARVIATTIRRKSGRLSGNHAKKRRSVKVPKILVNDGSDQYTDDDDVATGGIGVGSDDTYESFQKCIEPCSRSSTLLCTTNLVSNNNNHRPKRLKHIPTASSIPEITKIHTAKLTTPRMLRTPSTSNLRDHLEPSISHRTPPIHSPASTSSSRKLTTKNLPILI